MNETPIDPAETAGSQTAANEQIDFTKEDSFRSYVKKIRKEWRALSDNERTALWNTTKIFLRNHIEERIAKNDDLDLLLIQVSNLSTDTIFDGSEIQAFQTRIHIEQQKQKPNA